jgi:RNA polymerase sigma factor (sigma-70 family)
MANLSGRPCRSSRAGEHTAISHDLRAALRGAISTAIDELGPDKGELVRLHYKEGRTLQEAASLLGISYATVRRWNEDILRWFRMHLRAEIGTPVPLSETGT